MSLDADKLLADLKAAAKPEEEKPPADEKPKTRKTKKRQKLEADAAGLGIEFVDATGDEWLKGAIMDALERGQAKGGAATGEMFTDG